MLTRHAKLLETEQITLEPLFPITTFTPHSSCPHCGRIRQGSRFVCMVCHQSGQDHRLPTVSRRTADLENAADRIADRARLQRLREKPRKVVYSERYESN
jgi:hypothetical protein